jgi:hypothetical protein
MYYVLTTLCGNSRNHSWQSGSRLPKVTHHWLKTSMDEHWIALVRRRRRSSSSSVNNKNNESEESDLLQDLRVHVRIILK